MRFLRLENPRLRWTALIAAASIAGIALLIPVYVGQGLPWAHAIAAAVIVILPGMALALGVWRLEMSLPGLGAVHRIWLSVAFSGAWTAAITGLAFLVHPAAAASFLHNGAIWQFIGGLAVYGAVAAGARASRTQTMLRERELSATNAELRALRARLNPHFLFNTLHSLTQLAREDARATEDALERFGELMRYALHAGGAAGGDVAFEDELAFVRHYLALEELRLGDRIHIIEDVDPNALELAVPPLLLQPLVENAVRHGVAPRRHGATIRLGAQVIDDMLRMEVADNGCGADAAAYRESDGLGLKAVRRQIEAGYSGRGSFEVITGPGEGFVVRLTLPAHFPDRVMA